MSAYESRYKRVERLIKLGEAPVFTSGWNRLLVPGRPIWQEAGSNEKALLIRRMPDGVLEVIMKRRNMGKSPYVHWRRLDQKLIDMIDVILWPRI